MSFLSLSNVNVEFAKLGKLTWRFYNTIKALPITSQIELINKKEFAKVALDKNLETFIVHVSALEVTTIHLSQANQIVALQ